MINFVVLDSYQSRTEGKYSAGKSVVNCIVVNVSRGIATNYNSISLVRNKLIACVGYGVVVNLVHSVIGPRYLDATTAGMINKVIIDLHVSEAKRNGIGKNAITIHRAFTIGCC